MPCYRPVEAFYGKLLPSGKREIVFCSSKRESFVDLKLPCGTCVGCRLERARQWAMRCMDESSLHKENSFVTLTFNDENLPSNRSLDVSIFQKFMKRLRKDIEPTKVRFFHCGEYGPKTARPHYHSLLFGYGFPDREYLKVTKSGEKIYRSAQLDRLWGNGYASVGDVTFGSAAYVARYHLKKVGSVVSDNHYVNPQTGEMLSPEYVTMSRGNGSEDPVFGYGIGGGWYRRFKSDVYPRDSRVIKGVDTKPCKFYDSRYEIDDPNGYRALKLRRARLVDSKDNSEDRLLVKEKVKCAQIASLSNSLEEIYS